MNIKRNDRIDFIRGIAILLVVLGHTLSGCCLDYERSFLINVIWTLQMSLFFFISGYLTKYSKKIDDFNVLKLYIKKRTITYMMPWLIWTFVIRGILFNQNSLLDLSNLLWNMDSGYWFLASLWTITIIHLIVQYLSNKYNKDLSVKKQLLFNVLFYGVALSILILVGIIIGFSFFSLKQTIYYLLFYVSAYVFGVYQDKIIKIEWQEVILNLSMLLAGFIYLFLINRFDFYIMDDSLINIIIRLIASYTGCIFLFCLFRNISHESKISSMIRWFGIHSLEVYLVHYLLLPSISTMKISLFDFLGKIQLVVNYSCVILLCGIIIKILQKNQVLNKVLFWK